MKDEDDIPPHSDLAHAWGTSSFPIPRSLLISLLFLFCAPVSTARIKEKLPQFFRVRDIMNRPLPMLGQTDDMSPLAETSVAGAARHTSELRTNSRSATSSGLAIEVRLVVPRLYGHLTPLISMQTGVPTTYATSPILSPIASIGSARGQPRYYPPPVPPPLPRTSYISAFSTAGTPHDQIHRTPAPMTPIALQHSQSMHHEMETIPYESRDRISSEVRDSSHYHTFTRGS